MKPIIKPIAVCFGYEDQEQNLVFNILGSEVIVSSYVSEFQEVVRLCNGLRTVEEIVQVLPDMEDGLVVEIVSFLLKKGIVLESTKQYKNFHSASSNPSLFSIGLSSNEVSRLKKSPRLKKKLGSTQHLPTPKNLYLTEFAKLRQSTRVFSDVSLEFETVADFLQSIYGNNGHWFTPSAGGLYPIDIYLANFHNNGIEPGIYQFIPEDSELIRIAERVHLDKFCFALNSSELLNGSNQLIVLSVNLDRLSSKYSNRGYRYGLLEAGHVAQNAYLYASENNLGILEYGGYQDEELCRLFGLNPEKQPIAISLILGQKALGNSTRPELSMSKLSETLQNGMSKAGIMKDELLFRTYSQGRQVIPRVFAFGLYGLKDNGKSLSRSNASYSCASGHCLHEARIKVLAEAYERHVCKIVSSDVISRADELNSKYILPPLLSSENQDNMGIRNFSVDQVLQWKKGYRYSTGEEVLFPVEMVYYPVKSDAIGRAPIYKATSNGVAAHTNKTQAVLSATLELVERDSLMVHWFSKKPVYAIDPELIPSSISGRYSIFSKSGVKVKFVNISLDTTFVVLCLFRSETQKPFVSSGAGAALTMASAMEKAYNEAEFMFLSWRNMRYQSIDPNSVTTVKDHGRVYIDPVYHPEIEWLLNAEVRTCTHDEGMSADQLLEVIDPYVVEIAEPSSEVPLWVVRAISESLLPIHFGLGNDHDSTNRLRALGLKNERGYPSFPHFFS